MAQRNALSRGVAQQQTALAACGTGSLVSGAEGLMTLRLDAFNPENIGHESLVMSQLLGIIGTQFDCKRIILIYLNNIKRTEQKTYLLYPCVCVSLGDAPD